MREQFHAILGPVAIDVPGVCEWRILFDDSCTCKSRDGSSVYMAMHEAEKAHCPQHGPQHAKGK